MREVSAGIIIYRKTNEGPKFLLLYQRGCYWNFPKGKLEKEENSWVAALREIKEETGLTRQDLKFNTNFKVHDRYIYSRQKQKIFKTVVYFLAETRNPIIKISKEHQGYAWFLYGDAQRMLIHKNLKDNLKKAYDLIRPVTLHQGSRFSRSKRTSFKNKTFTHVKTV